MGCTGLKTLGMTTVDVDGMDDPAAVAEAASLSTWSFDTFRTDKKPHLNFNLYDGCETEWKTGLISGQAQNFARFLADTPSNHKPPRTFAKIAAEKLQPLGVSVTTRDRDWIKQQGMGGLLSVSQGSDEPPVFLEMHYKNSNAAPVCLVGKGVTFDTGGYALKPPKGMEQMRYDCGGAASVIGTMTAIAQLQLPINVIALVPLTENLINGRAVKPGDVITMLNGKTVAVDNPDAEGRLILGDALTYSARFNPSCIVDLATLTGAIKAALNEAAVGVFSNDTRLYEILRKAGSDSGDRVWRMPLWKYYTKSITDYKAYDVNNIGKAVWGGACTAAAFLKEFVPENVPWMHLDIAGVAETSGNGYVTGISGKPTRTMIYFLKSLSQKC